MSETRQHHEDVLLLVEGQMDEVLARGFLVASGLPADRVRFVPAAGKGSISTLARSLDGLGHLAILVDLDEHGVADARARAREQLRLDTPAAIFCAVPQIEAWLFADDLLVEEIARDDEEMLSIVRRLPLPEEIPRPRQMAREVFGPSYRDGLLVQRMDITRAIARSPSLRDFLEGMARLLGVPFSISADGVGRTLQRDTLSGLLSELPSETVVWRTMSGDAFTAGNLRDEIERGSEIGRQYAADLLRVSRDILRRSAARRNA